MTDTTQVSQNISFKFISHLVDGRAPISLPSVDIKLCFFCTSLKTRTVALSLWVSAAKEQIE